MPLVNVMVNGRAYTIACDEGEESHLRDLAGIVDAKAREVLGSVGHVDDSRLILMAALLLADEYHGLTAQLESVKPEGKPQISQPGPSQDEALAAETAAAEALEAAAARIESLVAARVH